MNEAEIRILWDYAAEQWPNYPVPTSANARKMRVQVWTDILGDLDAELVRAALGALADREFFPPVGVIRDRALELELVAKGEPERPSWEQSWDEVWEAVRRRGRADQPEWGHPITADVVRALGYDTLCDSQVDAVATVRAQFRDMHRLASARFERLVKRPTRAVAALELRGRDAALGRWDPSQLGAGE